MVGYQGMYQEVRPNGHARVLYEPRRNPVVQQHALELGQYCARIVLQGVEAVSPHQRDPDGHRVLVATELTKALLTEVYRMIGAVAGWSVEQRLPAYGEAIKAASQTAPPAPRTVQAAPRGPQPRAQKRAAARAQRIPRQAVANRRG